MILLLVHVALGLSQNARVQSKLLYALDAQARPLLMATCFLQIEVITMPHGVRNKFGLCPILPPIIVEPFRNCDEEDRREEGLCIPSQYSRMPQRLGDIALTGGVTPPTPCSEFIEALRSKLGVDERASRLMELGLRGRGLRGDAIPFGDAVRCPNGLGEDEERGERDAASVSLILESPNRCGGLGLGLSSIEKRFNEF